MRALIFGAFNPVTNAHIDMGIIARTVLGQDYNITYVPASDDYIKSWKGYKEGSVMFADYSVLLLRAEVSKHGFTVSTVETEGITDGKTYNTIKHFGFNDSILCLGMDNIIQMKKWYKWKELLARTRLLIFKRQGYLVNNEIMEILNQSCRYEITEMPSYDAGLSSTEVRNCYINRDMERLRQLVPESTYKYLEENEYVYF